MTTSSPGLHRVTPGPTFHTTPDASEPPMWWSSSGWYRKTETGCPSAAHTLLKFTPAAMTRTMTSNAPGSGTSISSTWKASSGSPSRSWRMTQAAIVAGSSPGSVSTCATCVRSTAIGLSALPAVRIVAATGGRRGAGTLLAVPVQVTRPPEPRRDHGDRAQSPPDAPDEERGERVDVIDEPAEVLAEEAGDDRERDEDRRQHAQARGDLVESVGRRLQVDVQGLGEQLAAVGGEVDREDEVVAHVGERVVDLAGLHVQHALDRRVAAGEHVALRLDDLHEPEEPRAELGDAPPVGGGGALEGPLLEARDLGLAGAHEAEHALGQRVEDAVDDLLVGVRVGLADGLEQAAPLAVDRDDPARREVDVNLDQLCAAGHRLGAVEADQQPLAVVVDLRALMELDGVLDGERREVEDLGQLADLRLGRRREVEPEEVTARAESADPVGVEVVEDVHPAPRR